MTDLMSIELDNEQRYKQGGMLAVEKHYKQAETTQTNGDTTVGQKLTATLFEVSINALTLWTETVLKPRKGAKPRYHILLQQLVEQHTTKVLAETATMVILNTLLNTLSKERCWLTGVASQVSKDLELELNTMLGFNKLADNRKEQVDRGLAYRSRKDYRMNYVKHICQHDNIDISTRSWNREDSQELCACFVYVLINASDWFVISDETTSTNIVATEKLLTAWRQNVDNQILMGRKFCPMVVPPKKWESLKVGGYYGVLSQHSQLLRLNTMASAYTQQYVKRLNQADISLTLQALNAIQETAWRVNTKVLDVANHILKNGGGRAGMPYLDSSELKPRLFTETPTELELNKYKKQMTTFIRKEKKRQSLCLRLVATLGVANEFKDYTEIYFPYNMDFRGRIYPLPSFNPQGDDITKGLIIFADNVPAITDEKQLEWLYVTGANLAGVDKVSYDDRIQWIKDNYGAIMASAEDPLGTTFWQGQDEPFQFLAFCFEMQDLKTFKATHGTAIGWKCHIPIAFDGTCSGLQHFSAILRDEIGGKAVNLTPSDKPQDIYGVVAGKVNVMLNRDAQKGTLDSEAEGKYEDTYIKLGTKTLAQAWLSYGVTRKVTKRNVMTLAYGSRQYGFKEQLIEDIIQPDIDANGDLSVFATNKAQFASYLSKLIWDAVSTTVVKAVEGMEWLQTIAKQITKDASVVMWTTPAGLPIQQHYMAYDVKTVQLRILNKRIRLYNRQDTGNIDKHKQCSGIAPNFIHSLDASHLQLTVKACNDQGIKHFAVVHDSYACPLAQADTLYKTVRQCFVDMYTNDDVLAEFAKHLQPFSNTALPQPPQKGSLDLTLVNQSPYFVC